MNNLFLKNLNQTTIKNKNNLIKNIKFTKRLIQDLSNVFEVCIEEKRTDETNYRFVVYPPSQRGRYGFGFEFRATPDSITFFDQRGEWLTTLARILEVKVTNDYHKKNSDLRALRDAVEHVGGTIQHSENSGCGDHYHLGFEINEQDVNLDQKIKLIIKVIQSHGVTTNI